MNATTPLTAADIAAFAASVRLHLADLPADDVDDLLDGLEADLAEQAAESTDFVLPDAAGYAAELRAAAGLPARAEGARPRIPLRSRLDAWRGAVARDIRSNPVGRWLLDLALALRPVWWLVRGGAIYAVLVAILSRDIDILPRSLLAWVLFGVALLVSVQWGRGRWVPTRWLRVIRTLVSLVAIVTLPFVMGMVFAGVRPAYAMTQFVDDSVPGLSLDHQRVRNIFAYDSEGNPIEGAQLFDQDGRPLTTVGNAGTSGGWISDDYFTGGGGPTTVPLQGPGLQPIWNVFPLNQLTPEQTWQGIDPRAAQAPAFPFDHVPAVADRTVPDSTAGPTPSPTATMTAPTESAAPEPSPTVIP